jgi:CheY-like chemotaxis protein
MEKFNRVLLIDDDDVDNYLHKSILEETKIASQISICRNGQEALTYIEQTLHQEKESRSNAELILLDINMPIMSGFEFLNALRELDINHYYTVILSSSDNIIDVQEAANYEVVYYICKPLTVDKVKKMMERCFE